MLKFIDPILQTKFLKAINDCKSAHPDTITGYRIQVSETTTHSFYILKLDTENPIPKSLIKRLTRMSKRFDNSARLTQKHQTIRISFPKS